MNQPSFKKVAIAAAAALTLAAGQAVAAPEFGVDQTATTGTYLGAAQVTGTQLNGNSSELLHFSNSDQTVTVNSGWLQFASIFNANSATTTLINANSGTGTYGLYVTFNFTTQYDAAASGGAPAGTAGSVYNIVSLNYNMFVDVTGNTTFVNASSSGTEAAVTGGSSDDVLIALGTLSTTPGSVAGFNTGGGAYLNSLENFALCSGVGTAKIGDTTIGAAGCTSSMGIDYFYDPVPFYSLAFDAFNNTGNSLGGRNGDLLAITQATGVVSFEGSVPEPTSLALAGIAMFGLGLTARRRSKR